MKEKRLDLVFDINEKCSALSFTHPDRGEKNAQASKPHLCPHKLHSLGSGKTDTQFCYEAPLPNTVTPNVPISSFTIGDISAAETARTSLSITLCFCNYQQNLFCVFFFYSSRHF